MPAETVEIARRDPVVGAHHDIRDARRAGQHRADRALIVEGDALGREIGGAEDRRAIGIGGIRLGEAQRRLAVDRIAISEAAAIGIGAVVGDAAPHFAVVARGMLERGERAEAAGAAALHFSAIALRRGDVAHAAAVGDTLGRDRDDVAQIALHAREAGAQMQEARPADQPEIGVEAKPLAVQLLVAAVEIIAGEAAEGQRIAAERLVDRHVERGRDALVGALARQDRAGRARDVAVVHLVEDRLYLDSLGRRAIGALRLRRHRTDDRDRRDRRQSITYAPPGGSVDAPCHIISPLREPQHSPPARPGRQARSSSGTAR